jgi:pimeloyl-ACP methyl ester carboxylesterase
MLKETIQSIQEELSISPATTVLYGRSAGGLLVISTATQSPNLVGGLYVESPYVDVLRTISNPDLPLTLLETKEFGIGTNPTNLIETGSWSPMEHTPKAGLPGLFILARSDLADLEVLPYEVVKWIRRVRGSPAKGLEKLLHVDSGQGHFATSLQTRAEDLALLDSWVETPLIETLLIETLPDARINNATSKYRMPNNGMSMRNRKNRKNTMRKNRKNRRNNVSNAPAANATMMGGRRRKNRKNTMRRNRH